MSLETKLGALDSLHVFWRCSRSLWETLASDRFQRFVRAGRLSREVERSFRAEIEFLRNGLLSRLARSGSSAPRSGGATPSSASSSPDSSVMTSLMVTLEDWAGSNRQVLVGALMALSVVDANIGRAERIPASVEELAAHPAVAYLAQDPWSDEAEEGRLRGCTETLAAILDYRERALTRRGRA